jgi:sterol desaturase/sphingolipid hydroxylase (fatty acid hydroxylase superfamily)
MMASADYLLRHEAWIKLGIFAGLLIILLMIEHFFARRKFENNPRRWLANVGLIISANLLTRLLFPVAGVGLAIWASANHFGLLHSLQLPIIVEIFAALIILDLAIYWQHRMFHFFPWLWRMHRVHHSDLGFDASLGVRFHPFEIALSQAYKLGAIALLGASPAAVVLYEILLMAFALMTHSNIRLPLKLDALLRIIFVTPDFHRVHHSVYREETDSNYGNILSLWDRLFSSYQAQPRDGHDAMLIGLLDFRKTNEQHLAALLIQPLRRTPSESETNHA